MQPKVGISCGIVLSSNELGTPNSLVRGLPPLKPRCIKEVIIIKIRTNRFVVYFTDEELSDLNNKSKKTNLSRGQFIRDCVSNKKIHELPPIDYSKFIFEVRRVGQNLNRLLQIAYSNGFLDVASINHCLEKIEMLDDEIYRAFFNKGFE